MPRTARDQSATRHPYPGACPHDSCMLVELAEHHFVILVNHLAAKVTAVDVGSLCPDSERHQAMQP